MKAILIAVAITVGAAGSLFLLQHLRPPEAVHEKTYYSLSPGENGIIAFQDFRDSTLTITYVMNGDTFTKHHIKRPQFNHLIRIIYPDSTREKVLQLKVQPVSIK